MRCICLKGATYLEVHNRYKVDLELGARVHYQETSLEVCRKTFVLAERINASLL